MAYKYRGTKFDAEPAPTRNDSTPGPKPGGFDPIKCGEYRGVKQHYRYNVPLCDPCKRAYSDYQKSHRDTRPRVLQPCGTRAAYSRHIAAKEPVCAPCNAANNENNRNQYRLHAVTDTPFDASACGTYKGYRRHHRRGIEPCTPCRAAANQYIADYRAKKAAA